MGRKGYFKDDNCVHFKLIHNTGKDAEKAPTVMQAFIPERLARKGIVEVKQETLDEFADSNSEDFSDSDGDSSEYEDSLDGDCYYPPDGYDYEQHLKFVNDQQVYNAPELVSLANTVSLPREDIDILQALDDEEEAFSEEEEDFFNDLCSNRPMVPVKKLLWGDYEPILPVMPSFARTTNTAPAPIATAEDDEDFEALLEDYADSQLGAGDYEESEPDEEVAAVTREMRKLASHRVDPEVEQAELLENAQVTRALLDALSSSDEGCEIKIVRSKKDKWDCESILSFRSNISNHPSKISRAQKSTLRPLKEEVDCEIPELISVHRETISRSRDETPEERNARKAAVKEAQAAARKAKKENSENSRRAKLAKNLKKAGNGDILPGLSKCSF